MRTFACRGLDEEDYGSPTSEDRRNVDQEDRVEPWARAVDRVGLSQTSGPKLISWGRGSMSRGGETRKGLMVPDWARVHREMRRKGVTLSLLWERSSVAITLRMGTTTAGSRASSASS